MLLWDATPLTPELRVLREARSVFEFLSAKKLPPAEIVDRIRKDPTISDAVRTRALSLAEPAAEKAGQDVTAEMLHAGPLAASPAKPGPTTVNQFR